MSRAGFYTRHLRQECSPPGRGHACPTRRICRAGESWSTEGGHTRHLRQECSPPGHNRPRCWQEWNPALLAINLVKIKLIMPNFKRYDIPNGIVFITTVTRDRYPFLKSKRAINLFFETMQNVREIHPFKLFAYVILPDHFHWLMKVDDPTGDFSRSMQSFKRNFTLNYKKAYNIQTPISIWQRRFWDHVIRDEKDLERHFDYIHWNPIKHDYVCHPEEWPHSTYRYWLERNYYKSGWGWSKEPDNIIGMDME